MNSISPGAPQVATEWRVVPERSRVGFAVRKLGFGTVRGHFEDAEGTLGIDGAGLTARGSVRVAAVDTRSADRDAHLRGPAFFDADAFPEISFRSRAIVADGASGLKIVGYLTIRDVRRTIELTATRTSPTRLQVRGSIDRRDFGLTWSAAIEASGVVSAKVALELDLELEH